MKKYFSICGIFATIFVVTTIILLASCDKDDDYYDSGMYTLAEAPETRGYAPEDYPPPVPLLYYYLNSKEYEEHTSFSSVDIIHQASCRIGLSTTIEPQASSTPRVLEGSLYDEVSITHWEKSTGTKFGELGIIINYCLKYRNKETQAVDSCFQEYFIPLDTITYMSNETVVQPNN